MNRSRTRNYAVTELMAAPARGLRTVWVPQIGAHRGAEGPEQRHAVSRDMAELLGEQDRTLQAGNGRTEDRSLKINGELKRVESETCLFLHMTYQRKVADARPKTRKLKLFSGSG